MRKSYRVVGEGKRPVFDISSVEMFDTAEEAAAAAKREAEQAGVEPSSVMMTFEGGHVTGEGEVHSGGKVWMIDGDMIEPKTDTATPEDDAVAVIEGETVAVKLPNEVKKEISKESTKHLSIGKDD